VGIEPNEKDRLGKGGCIMSLEDNKAMARRANAIWASGNSEKFEDIFTDGYLNHQEPDIAGGVSVKNLEVYKELLAKYHSTFSSSRNEVLMQGDTDQRISWGPADRKRGDLDGHPDRPARERQDRRELGRLGQVQFVRPARPGEITRPLSIGTQVLVQTASS